MPKWMPERKVWAGGLLPVAAAIIAYFSGLPEEAVAAVAGVVATVAAQYFIPPSAMDFLRRIDGIARNAAMPTAEQKLLARIGQSAAAEAIARVKTGRGF